MAGHPVYRVAHAPDPWTWPDWGYVNADNTFDNRWDDPEGSYRVLYASSQRAGAFVETLARFRADFDLIAGLEKIADDGPGDAPIPAGTVPWDWPKGRMIGKAVLKGDFADVTHPKSITYLREQLAEPLSDLGLRDVDAGTVRTMNRGVTQLMSRKIYECSVEGQRAYAGVYYRSRLGDTYENWGVFDTAVSGVKSPISALDHGDDIRLDDPDLREALSYLHLTVEPDPAPAEAKRARKQR